MKRSAAQKKVTKFMEKDASGISPQLRMTKWGFFQYAPMPSDAELKEHYAAKYFQENTGTYNREDAEDQKAWWRLRSEITAGILEGLMSSLPFSLLDVGCGPGWLMETMYRRGHEVHGFDFSKAAIEKAHPHLLSNFTQGNIYDLLDEYIRSGKSVDSIFLGNVIEHVTDPESLLLLLKKALKSHSILTIVAPNDFSSLQQCIIDNNFAESPWWLAYPEHLSYFNFSSMHTFLNDLGFEVIKTIGDFPMEFNLMATHSNYVKDRGVGPEAHLQRIRIDRYLYERSPEALAELYTVLGGMGIGRNLIYFCRLASK